MKTALAKPFSSISEFSDLGYEGIIGGLDGYSKFVKTVNTSAVGKTWTKLNDAQLLWQIPKVSLLLSDTCLMFGSGGQTITVKLINKLNAPFQFTVPSVLLPKIQGKTMWPGFVHFQSSVIRTWFDDARSLIEDGRAIYLPERILLVEGASKEGRNSWDALSMHQAAPWNMVLPTNFYTAKSSNSLITTPEPQTFPGLMELLDLSLPFIHGISLDDFYKLYQDKYDSVVLLRAALASAVDAIAMAGANTVDPAVLASLAGRLRRDTIDPELAKLNLAYKRVVSSKTFSVAGATISTVALSSAAIFMPSIAAYVAVLGGSGVLASLKEFADYKNNRDAMKENPFYFMWKLKQTQQLH